MHGWNTFGARMSDGHTWTHKIHYSMDLGEAITFPLIIFFFINHGGCIQMSFWLRTLKLGVSKFPKLGLLAFWKAITFYVDLCWGEVENKVLALVEKFSKVCGTPPEHTYYMAIFDF
jgi:hypothetical protein